MVLMAEDVAKARGLRPIARIRAIEDAAVNPIDFGIAPTDAVKKILKKTGI